MRRNRRGRSSGREQSVEEHYDTHGMEAEPLPQEPDDNFPLRPFAEREIHVDELPDVPLTDKGPDPARMLRRARRAARGGRRSDALQAYRDLLEIAQDSLEGRLELARLLETSGEIDAALTQLSRAVDLAPDKPEVLTERGALRARLKHYVEAEADLTRALQLDPSYAPALFHSGLVQLRKGRPQGAAASFRQALAGRDDLPGVYFYLGEALNLLGDFEPAIDALERATEREPGEARGYQLLGRVLDSCGRPEEAMIMYQKAREVGRR